MTDETVSRRSFVASCAAAAFARGLGRTDVPRPQQGQPASAIKLGVASYSLREFPLDAALEMITALRTPFVNFKSMHVPYDKTPVELAALRRRIERDGFQIVGGGTITFEEDTDAGVEKYFVYAKAAGMPTIVCTGEPTVLPRIETFAKRYDIKIAIHNHGPEDRIFPTPYSVLERVKDMDARMGLCIDVGHTARTGTDVVKAVRDAGPRLHDMHMKDLADPASIDSQVAVGEGKLPIPEIFRALEAIRYAGYVNLEYEINSRDPLPGMRESFAYMRGVLAGSAIRNS